MAFERCRNVILLVCFYLLLSHFATSASNPTSSLPPTSAHESASTPTFAPVHLPHVWIEFSDGGTLSMRVEQPTHQHSHAEADHNASLSPQSPDSAQDARQEDVEYCLESDCDKPNKQCESWAHCGRSCTIDPLKTDHFDLTHKPCRFRVGGRQTFWVNHSQVIRAPEVRYLLCLISFQILIVFIYEYRRRVDFN